MRIALVSQEYPPETAHGGIATQTFAKARGLAARGHEVHVISHSVDGARHEHCDGEVRVRRIPGFDTAMPIHTEPARWLTYSALVAAELAALHQEYNLDLVDFPDWGCEAYVHLINRNEHTRLPTVIHLHGPLVMLAHTIGWPQLDSELYRVGTAMEATCLRLADAIVSSSACSVQWCAERYGVDAHQIPVIHTGVDTRCFRPRLAAKAQRPTVLFVGRVARSKGVELLVEAASEVAADIDDLRLRLIGRCETGLATELRARVQQRGYPDLLELAGFVPHAELPQELCRAHVFAAPSRYEGGPGFVYLEAMACGLPVIACAGSGSAEVVSDGTTGHLVPPDDAASLATALRTLLEDEARREQMAQMARAYAVHEADSQLCVQRLEQFYCSVVAGQQ